MSGSQDIKKNLWHNPWIVAIGSLVIGTFILNWLTDWIRDILEFAKKVIIGFLGFLNESIPLPIWVILLLVGVLFLLSKNILGTIINKESTSIINYPFLIYTSDKFGDLLYRWSYEKNYEDKFNISNITAFCPLDNCRLNYRLECPICFQRYNPKDEDELQILIRHRIENNLYKQN